MNAPNSSPVGEGTLTTPVSMGVDEPVWTTDVGAYRRRRTLVNVLRVLVAVVLLGGWELGSRVG